MNEELDNTRMEDSDALDRRREYEAAMKKLRFEEIQECDCMSEEWRDALQADITELQTENKILRTALEFAEYEVLNPMLDI